MPTYFLPEDVDFFPHPLLADEFGMLAISQSLSPKLLDMAYYFGIFPWYNPGEVVQWFYPNPRSVIYPSQLHVSKSMRTYFNNEKFHWSMNQEFDEVIRQCQIAKNRIKEGTWIGEEIIEAYTALNRKGRAHSVEVWNGDALVGGLYGIWIGKVFFGESMFSLESNASKFGLISFIKRFHAENKLNLVDCQIENRHLNSLGARNISGEAFLAHIRTWVWPAGLLLP